MGCGKIADGLEKEELLLFGYNNDCCRTSGGSIGPEGIGALVEDRVPFACVIFGTGKGIYSISKGALLSSHLFNLYLL
jgi:hypothetical protein